MPGAIPLLAHDRRAWLAPLGFALAFTMACDLDEVDVKDQDGAAIQVDSKAGKKILTAPDGSQYTVTPSGTIIDPDGKKTKLKRDGTIIQPDGSRVNIYGDGTKATMKIETVEIGKEGDKVLVHDDGSRTTIKGDGTVERVYKDGTRTSLSTKPDEAPK